MVSNSLSLSLLPKVTTNSSQADKLVDEKIDERILRLLGLEDVFDIDYDTYSTILKEKLVEQRMTSKKIPTEEVELLTDEWKRIRRKKGRFKVKKISAKSFKKSASISFNKNSIKGLKPKGLLPASIYSAQSNPYDDIINSLNNIISYLKDSNTILKNKNRKDQIQNEQDQRGNRESLLEKGFSAAVKVAERILSPVKSLLSRIIDFFMAIFWGKVLIKLVDWLANKENQKKIQSLFRFLNDHWPKLLALYLRFGTGLGRFVGGLTKLVFFGTRKLLQVAASMLGAKAAAKFLGGRGGRLVAGGLQVAATVGTTMAISSGIESFVKSGQDEKIPNFFGGGLVNLFKNIRGFFGGGHSSPGYVSGTKGVDKIPAMLSDGEFVMSRGAVQKYGVNMLEAMNASGGGTNRPKMIRGTTYAAGGGLVGSDTSLFKYSSDMIKSHEALSSLKPGQNYYVNSKSPEFAKVTQSTKIYPYIDSVGVPTIGWGSTYYDSILSGKKKVRASDPPITKKTADNILHNHLSSLIPRAKSVLPLWDKMSPQQKGTVISFMYNAGPNSINIDGPYPKFSKALISGNMKEAAANVNRGGPSQHRISEEKKLLMTGPLDLTKVKTPQEKNKKTTTTPSSKPQAKKSDGFLNRFLSIFSRGGDKSEVPSISPNMSFSTNINQTEIPRSGSTSTASNPSLIQRTPLKTSTISPPVKPQVVMRSSSKSSTGNITPPVAPGVPQIPSFSVSFNENRERVLAIHGIA